MNLQTIIPTSHILEWRRHIHQHPELSHQEKETAAYIRAQLEKIGVDEIVSPTPTSLIATINGASPGKTVLFRADIDALPIEEETGLPFRSVNPGVMHACGHDTHAAMLLGTAEVLTQLRGEFNGTVKLLFQHAEEVTPSGAEEIVASGALKGIDAGFGMHIFPNQVPGGIGIVPGGHASSNSDKFDLKIFGHGAHSSTPHVGVDPILVGAEIVLALNTIVSRNVSPDETAVVSVGAIHAGNANNIIPDTAEIRGNVRTIHPDTRALIRKRVETIVKSICDANGASFEMNYEYSVDMMINDPALSAFAKKVCIDALGEDHVVDAKPMLGSEDFAFYCREFPCCFLFLSGGLPVEGPVYANHHPKFDIIEDALPSGTLAQVRIISDFLKSDLALMR